MATPRRFPTSWSVEERPGCYIVKDATGFPLAYVYYEEEPGRRTAANLMTQDEARHRCEVATGWKNRRFICFDKERRG